MVSSRTNVWCIKSMTKQVFFFFFVFLRESFNLWHPLLMIALYHQTKTPISFWYRQGLNPRSLIQPSKSLPIELTGTHND